VFLRSWRAERRSMCFRWLRLLRCGCEREPLSLGIWESYIIHASEGQEAESTRFPSLPHTFPFSLRPPSFRAPRLAPSRSFLSPVLSLPVSLGALVRAIDLTLSLTLKKAAASIIATYLSAGASEVQVSENQIKRWAYPKPKGSKG
jgi:hypothetical protein